MQPIAFASMLHSFCCMLHLSPNYVTNHLKLDTPFE